MGPEQQFQLEFEVPKPISISPEGYKLFFILNFDVAQSRRWSTTQSPL